MNVQTLGVKRTVSEVIPEVTGEKLKVAAYCRVSTDFEEQESSYEVQVSHYTSFIEGNRNWTLAGIYADDGISATSMKHRDAFNRMISDAMDGKIDRILTKSISRFARNTVDCLTVVRKLKQKGVSVFFEKEDIDTKTEEGEFILTIRASLAQQESESISKNTKLGVNYRFQRGEVMVNHNRFLGYTRTEKNGPLVIVPEQAAIVRRIYREYLEGATTLQIARGLSADGIKNGAGSTKWWDSNIHQILTNEKYMGDALLQKTVTIDPLEKVRRKNRNNEPQYYVESSHPAIVSKAVFNSVQAELSRRSKRVKETGKPYNPRLALSGIVFCGDCGSPYRRLERTPYAGGEKYAVWRCEGRVNGKGCQRGTVRETKLQVAIMEAIAEVYVDRESLTEELRNDLSIVLGGMTDELMAIDAEISTLQEKILKKAMADEDATELSAKVDELRTKREEIAASQPLKSGFEARLQSIMENLGSRKELSWDDQLVRKLVEKVEVFKGEVLVTFNGGKTVRKGI